VGRNDRGFQADSSPDGPFRQAGWDQVPWADGAWPLTDQVISIRLAQADWTFAADEARESIEIYEELGDEVSAQLGRDVLAVIERTGH